jgi:hypothetical protein
MNINKMNVNHVRALVVFKKYLPPIKYNFINKSIEKDNEKKLINNNAINNIKYTKKYEEKFCPFWISKNF